MRYVAAFRTYTWDEGVAELARRFFAAFPSGRHVVFANEAKGPLGILGYEVISHGDDTSELGLPDHPPGNPHWYNVDYALYIVRRVLPDYDHYVMSESDLAVNLCLELMIADMSARGVAMILHQVQPAEDPWHWHANAQACFDDPWRAMSFFMAAAGATIDALYRMRLEHAAEFSEGRRPVWPFCETFLPSALQQMKMSIGDVADYANTDNLRFRPRLCLDDPRANQAGAMAHSVLSPDIFYTAVLRENDPRDWFVADSALRQALEGHDLLAYADALLDGLQRGQDHAPYQELRVLMSHAGRHFEPEEDLAFCKPATTSSVSPWSHHQDPQRDAAGANGLQVFEDGAFHTAEEDGPWWMVDLLETFAVDEVVIVNRVGHADRFRQFVVESSTAATSWTARYMKLDYGEVSSDPQLPFRITFPDPFTARYIRIRLMGRGFLHLRRVRVFGRGPLAPLA